MHEYAFTKKQGQYLAFIHMYTKLNNQPPAEADMGRYFHVTPPSVHSMVLELEKRAFISREKGRPRSIRIAINPEHIPSLE
jgi:Mn-dependent DtxR family transcriptional regulator